VDDPLDSGAVHFGNGLLGTMMLALFAKPEHVEALVGTPCGGVFYNKNGWLQLGMQTLGEWVGEGRGGAVCIEVALHRGDERALSVSYTTRLASGSNPFPALCTPLHSPNPNPNPTPTSTPSRHARDSVCRGGGDRCLWHPQALQPAAR